MGWMGLVRGDWRRDHFLAFRAAGIPSSANRLDDESDFVPDSLSRPTIATPIQAALVEYAEIEAIGRMILCVVVSLASSKKTSSRKDARAYVRPLGRVIAPSGPPHAQATDAPP